MIILKRLLTTLFCLLLTLITNSCGVYTFNGVNIPPDIKTFSIQNIFNNAGNGPANLGQKLTQSLRDYFQKNTSLLLVNTEGDLRFDGSITGYSIAPIAPTASTANNPYPTSSTRLTITVKVNLVNTKDEKGNYEQTFSQYADIAQSESLATAENNKVDEIIEKLQQDIFNKTFSNW